MFLFVLAFVANALAGSFMVQGKLSHKFTLTPSEVAGGKVTIQGGADEDIATVDAKTIDYLSTEEGISTYRAGTLGRSAAEWIQLSRRQIEVAAGGTASLEWTVRVPEGTLPGTYWAAIVLSPSATPPNERSGPRSIGLARVQEYAVTISVDVPGGRNSFAFGARRLTQRDGKSVLSIALVNDGAYRVRPKLYADVYDESGAEKRHITARQVWIYPETTHNYDLPLDDLPPGKYSLLIVAEDKRLDPIGAQYTIELR